jgi:hypothetical protein
MTHTLSRPTIDFLNQIPGSQQGGYPGFDWFAATVFLMMNGHKDRAWKVLHKMSSLIHSAYLWMRRLHASVSMQGCYSPSGLLLQSTPLLPQGDLPRKACSALDFDGAF